MESNTQNRIFFKGHAYELREYNSETPVATFSIGELEMPVSLCRSMKLDSFEPQPSFKLNGNGLFPNKLFDLNKFDDILPYITKCAPEATNISVYLNMNMIISKPLATPVSGGPDNPYNE